MEDTCTVPGMSAVGHAYQSYLQKENSENNDSCTERLAIQKKFFSKKQYNFPGNDDHRYNEIE